MATHVPYHMRVQRVLGLFADLARKYHVDCSQICVTASDIARDQNVSRETGRRIVKRMVEWEGLLVEDRCNQRVVQYWLSEDFIEENGNE